MLALRTVLALSALSLLPLSAPVGLAAEVQATRAFPNLGFSGNPLYLTSAPDSTNRIFVVEQTGKILVFPNKDSVQPAEMKTFLDLSDTIHDGGGELGLLGLAFPPDFAAKDEFYVSYTDKEMALVVARAKVSVSDENRAEKSTLETVIRVPKKQKFSNHNGGMIAFSPKDGMLYVATGDGGSGGDPNGNAQKKSELLGKILRIDPRSAKPYKVPADNPFVGQAGAKGEIWAYGMRNTWRFSFEQGDGTLWAGDVGQNEIEEIDVIVKGGNYGWNVMEGNSEFKNPGNLPPSTFIAPVITYKHPVGFSVTGGYVYRGTKAPMIAGQYIYGDFATGVTWALKFDAQKKAVTNTKILTLPNLASFGEDASGELYAVSLTGQIFRITQK